MEATTQKKFDVTIVGGGMVGAAAALAFAKQGKRVALIEKHIPKREWLSEMPLRVSAINLFSEQYLTELGVWSFISDDSKCQFEHLSTWEQGTSPLTFSASEINKSHLGFLIRNEALQLAAYEAFSELERADIELYTDFQLAGFSELRESIELQLTSQAGDCLNIESRLLIGADGANSQLRQLANIGISGWDYQQHCLSITIKTEFPQQDITWQEFQPSGPKAFLPLANGYASLIWYDSPERISHIKQMTDNEQIKQELLATFPPLPGDFSVAQLASFPLTRRQANQYIKGRLVLVGDAAHTINPLAGQGVNLGYKDVAALAGNLSDANLADHADLNKALLKYQRERKLDSQIMSGAMDSFYLLFSNDKTPLKAARKGLLDIANSLPWAKKQVLKKAVGL